MILNSLAWNFYISDYWFLVGFEMLELFLWCDAVWCLFVLRLVSKMRSILCDDGQSSFSIIQISFPSCVFLSLDCPFGMFGFSLLFWLFLYFLGENGLRYLFEHYFFTDLNYLVLHWLEEIHLFLALDLGSSIISLKTLLWCICV